MKTFEYSLLFELGALRDHQLQRAVDHVAGRQPMCSADWGWTDLDVEAGVPAKGGCLVGVSVTPLEMYYELHPNFYRVESAFDEFWESFVTGEEEFRMQRLELILQLELRRRRGESIGLCLGKPSLSDLIEADLVGV